MKTIEQWLNELRDPYRTEALEAFHNSPNSSKWADTKFVDPMNAIRWAFNMSQNGGNKLWTEIGENWSKYTVDLLERDYNRIPKAIREWFDKECLDILSKQEKQMKLGTRQKLYMTSRYLIWKIRMETSLIDGKDGYKVNDHHSPVLARMFERKHPKYKGVFVKKKTQYDV